MVKLNPQTLQFSVNKGLWRGLQFLLAGHTELEQQTRNKPQNAANR